MLKHITRSSFSLRYLTESTKSTSPYKNIFHGYSIQHLITTHDSASYDEMEDPVKLGELGKLAGRHLVLDMCIAFLVVIRIEEQLSGPKAANIQKN